MIRFVQQMKFLNKSKKKKKKKNLNIGARACTQQMLNSDINTQVEDIFSNKQQRENEPAKTNQWTENKINMKRQSENERKKDIQR